MTQLPVALAALLIALAGCSSTATAPAGEDRPVNSPTSSATTPSLPPPTSSATTQQTLSEIVHDPHSTLYAVSVRQASAGYEVSAWWTLKRGNEVDGAIVTSDDRFESARYERGSWRNWAKHQPLGKKVPAPAIEAFKGLLGSPVRSLAPSIRAFVAGGDGATLLPFEAVARSVSGGAWRGYTVPKTQGDQAYDDGDLVLSDGRFLVLLNDWSSDRRRMRGPEKLGPEYHGLWVSAGDDWAHYTPLRPTFAPALATSDAVSGIQPEPGPGPQAPHGLVVATTQHNLLYVSTDDARTFHSVRAR